jgi:hypothetical protein
LQADVRNDVKPSVGRVVISDWLESVDASSISGGDEACMKMGCYKHTSVDVDRSILFDLFYCVYFAIEKHRNAHL